VAIPARTQTDRDRWSSPSRSPTVKRRSAISKAARPLCRPRWAGLAQATAATEIDRERSGARQGLHHRGSRVEEWMHRLGFGLHRFQDFPGRGSVSTCRAVHPLPPRQTGRADQPRSCWLARSISFGMGTNDVERSKISRIACRSRAHALALGTMLRNRWPRPKWSRSYRKV